MNSCTIFMIIHILQCVRLFPYRDERIRELGYDARPTAHDVYIVYYYNHQLSLIS